MNFLFHPPSGSCSYGVDPLTVYGLGQSSPPCSHSKDKLSYTCSPCSSSPFQIDSSPKRSMLIYATNSGRLWGVESLLYDLLEVDRAVAWSFSEAEA